MSEAISEPILAPRTICLRLSYDGSDYHGWQAQPGRATIQGRVAEAIAAVTGETVVPHGSGRTDAGVHALGQAVHFRIAARLPAENLLRALNARLPSAIRVVAAEVARDGFHARRDAVSKLYRYRIFRDPVCPPFLCRYVFHYPYPLDEAAMMAAAPGFVGMHDFRSFAASPDKRTPPLASTRREVLRSGLERRESELVYEVEGRGFLHHMVRNLVGFLLEVGRGARRGEEIPAVLAAARRRAAGPTAPARGLYLVNVSYGAQAEPCIGTQR